MRLAGALAAVVALAAASPARVAAQTPAVIARMVDSLRPYVEGASGLRFVRPPRAGVRSRPEVREYIERRIGESLDTTRLRGLAVAYHLFGLLPDTTGFRGTLLDLYAEQIRGYYDPHTDTLYGVQGASEIELREVLAHEMVHAVQAQHLDLRVLYDTIPDNDRRTAAQSVIEGQATFATIRLLSPRVNLVAMPQVWNEIVRRLRERPARMPAYRRAPPFVREAMLAPYLRGAEFVSWWNASRFGDTLPFGSRMPVSTEQILHPERYAAGDRPVRIRFADGADAGGAVLLEDGLGELEVHLLGAALAGRPAPDSTPPIGWGGDRYRVYDTPAGAALVWYSVWDDPESADAFARGIGAALAARRRTGYRAVLEPQELGGRPGFRYVFAPERWDGWARLPAAVAEP